MIGVTKLKQALEPFLYPFSLILETFIFLIEVRNIWLDLVFLFFFWLFIIKFMFAL